jgi:hypothetical protein
LARRFDEALPKLLVAIQEDPGDPTPYRYLAACYAHIGQLDAGRDVVTRLRSMTSVVILDADYLRRAEDREFILLGQKLALGQAG